MGIIKLVENDLEISEDYIKMAFDFGVRTENDMSLLNLTQSEIYLKKGQLDEARKYFDAAKNIPHKPSLDDYLKEFENKLYQKT